MSKIHVLKVLRKIVDDPSLLLCAEASHLSKRFIYSLVKRFAKIFIEERMWLVHDVGILKQLIL